MSIQVRNIKHIYEKGMPTESVALDDIRKGLNLSAIALIAILF